MFYKFKEARCKKCKYKHLVGKKFYCERYDRKWGLKLLYPLKLICFKFKKDE